MNQRSSPRPRTKRAVFSGEVLIFLLYFAEVNVHQDDCQNYDFIPSTDFFLTSGYFTLLYFSCKKERIMLPHCDIV